MWQPAPPLHLLDWVMLFDNDGQPASAILTSNDSDLVKTWARDWVGTTSGAVTLHRRTVLIGRWFPHDKVVDVELPQISTDAVPRQRLR